MISKTLVQPDTFYARLKFNHVYQRAPATVSDDIGWIANGPYDCDPGSGVNNQPTGFSQYAALYKQYQVMASKIQITAINNSNLVGQFHVVYPSFDTTTLSYEDAYTQPYARRMLITNSAGGPGKGRITNFVRIKKFVGRAISDTSYSANVTALPAKQLQWHWHGLSSDQSTNFIGTLEVAITFYVKFWQRDTVPQGIAS